MKVLMFIPLLIIGCAGSPTSVKPTRLILTFDKVENAVNYKMYSGSETGVYPDTTVIGNRNKYYFFQVPGVSVFAVSAIDSSGKESKISKEAIYK